ncbi:hypothetical protein J31TS4_36200 [Paenibacillus sp. J31TS4]|uniref:YihY/virulence factor BrkB family protein n=1 Tax=Paenibacillus sp. J31TS4 TaxID=2807195 RepID=UPI001B14C36B|nr:YihY/virulence factor BrkB family protein [Paenibacillus sp. J31TS4]GIP40340.1 hypothetical protein J31TS4_36200 [Paenibacillus sp. J31TS4]
MKSKWWSFAQNLYCRFQDDEVPAMGAMLTYYLILSIFPFLIFLVSLVGFVSMDADSFVHTLTAYLPQSSAETVTKFVAQIQEDKSRTLLSIGMIATIWSASSGIMALIKSLNKAYDEEETRPFWKVRGVSILATLALALVILSSFGMLVFGQVIGEKVFALFPIPGVFEQLWNVLQFVLPLLVILGVFLLLYRYAPNLHLRFKEVLPGALFATVSWAVFSIGFSFYVNNFGNYTKTYGSIGGIIVFLTWLYLSSTIIVLGGEINATLAFDRSGKQRAVCKKFALPNLPFLHNKQDNQREIDPDDPLSVLGQRKRGKEKAHS